MTDWQTLVNGAATPVLIHSAQTKRILWANTAAVDALGYTLEELHALKAHHMSAQESNYRREVGLAWMQSAIVYGRSTKTWKYLKADGSDLLTNATCTHMQFTQEAVLVVEFTPIDIVESSTPPKWISESFNRLMTHTSSGVLVLDQGNRVQDASPFASNLFGLRQSDMLGAYLGSLATLDPPLDSEIFRSHMLSSNRRANIRFKVSHRDGEPTWLAGLLEDVDFEGQTLRVLTVRDISDRIEAERQTAYQQSNLQYLSRYNAMGDIAMILAHDLGQPLAASSNFLAGLRARIQASKAEPKDINYAIEQTQRQLKRASDIVSSVRRYVRRIESTATEINLIETLEDSLYFVRLNAEEHGINVVVDTEVRELISKGESVLIGQVIMNLCINAIQEIAKPSTAVKELRIVARRESEYACIYISDQGTGMGSAPENRLADGAFSSKQDGSGIGLIISEHIVERHGGTLSFLQNSPQGTTVKLVLPLINKPNISANTVPGFRS